MNPDIVNAVLSYHAHELLDRHSVEMTLLHREPPSPETGLPDGPTEGVGKSTISLLVAEDGVLYGFIYRQSACPQIANNALLGAFLKVSEGAAGDRLTLNAYLLRLTRNHAIGWLECASAGKAKHSFLTLKNAVDTDYAEIWRLGHLPWNAGSPREKTCGFNTFIVDTGGLRRIGGLLVMMNNIFEPHYRITVTDAFSSMDGIAWARQVIICGPTRFGGEPQRLDFHLPVFARYFKFAFSTGEAGDVDGVIYPYSSD